jgi:hypothetical protein
MKTGKYFVGVVAFSAILGGCQAPPSPLVRAFGDNNDWIVAEDMTWTIGHTGETIVVPKGFITDYASIPQFLWSFGLSPHGQYSRAAVLHDYLYWSQGCTRAQSDRLLVIAMKESEVGSFDESAIYQGVDKFGASAWHSNARERAMALPKIVPDEYLIPANPNINWNSYRAMLAKQGVKDPPFPRNPPYCAYGNSTAVP